MKQEILNLDDLNKNYKITKSNKLIEANYNLTLNEQRIILSAVSKIQPIADKKKIFNIIQFNINDLKELLEIKNDKFLYEIRDIAKQLGSKSLYIQELNSDEFINIQWLSSSQYIKQKNALEIEFSSKMMPYLIDLASNFTTYELESILKFRCSYSIRVYELIKQFQNTQTKENGYKERVFELTRLKQLLGVENGSYSIYSNLKMRILKPSCDEINKYTEFNIFFEESKKGKKVEKIKFLFKLKNSASPEIEENNDKNKEIEEAVFNAKVEAVQNIIDKKINLDDAKSLYIIAKGDLGKIASKYFMIKSKNINNLIGYLIKAIEEDYNDIPVAKEKVIKNRFHNLCESRTDNYTAEELERIILENQERR